MIESERALDGIKLLHLRGEDGGRGEKKFEIVDAVCREILLGKVLATKVVLPPPPPPVVPTLPAVVSCDNTQ